MAPEILRAEGPSTIIKTKKGDAIVSSPNKQTVLQYVEAFNRGDIDGLCKLSTTDALIYGVLGWGARDSADGFPHMDLSLG